MLIEQAVQTIIDNPSPVLFLDTCSLLDITRTAMRTRAENSTAVRTIIFSATGTQRRVWTILIHQVRTEWKRHVEAVRKEVGQHISKTDAAVNRVYEVLRSVSPIKERSPLPMAEFMLESRLEQFALDLMETSLQIEEHNSCLQSATQRAIARRAPAERGGSIEDCVILEHCLSIAAKLFIQHFYHPLVLVTSNKRDYGTPGQMPTDLQQDFDAVRLQLATDLEHARAILGL